MIAAATSIENVVFDVVAALRVPVLIAALLALAVVVFELGSLTVELVRRRRRDSESLELAATNARQAVAANDRPGAAVSLRATAASKRIEEALVAIVNALGEARTENRIAKGLADFDLSSIRRLERTRMLVRAGPALGLMGTLIPLTPALDGLARGDTQSLSDNLRAAFSITVLGLMIGALAFGISLVRDRLYAQDLSDLEFVVATLTEEEVTA